MDSWSWNKSETQCNWSVMTALKSGEFGLRQKELHSVWDMWFVNLCYRQSAWTTITLNWHLLCIPSGGHYRRDYTVEITTKLHVCHNLQHADLWYVEIFTRVCTCWNSGCPLQRIIPWWLVIEPYFNFLKTLALAIESICSIRIYLYWKKLLCLFWWLKSPIAW